jgi:hypothetical protein
MPTRKHKTLLLTMVCLGLLLIIFPGAASILTPDHTRLIALGGFSDADTSKPITVIAQITFDPEWEFDDDAPIWLLRLSDEQDEPVLGLEWSVSQTGWFPTWQLNLKHARDDQTLEEPCVTAMPRAGDTYIGALSYDPASGWVSVMVSEESSGHVLYRGAHKVDSLLPCRRMSAGSQTSGVALIALNAYGLYLPLDATLNILSHAGTGPRLGTRVFDRSDGAIHIRLSSENTGGDGQFLVTAHELDAAKTRAIGPLTSATEEVLFTLEDLASVTGRVDVNWQYKSAGHVWLSSSTDISIGWLSVDVLGVEIDEDAGLMKTRILLAGDAPIRTLPLRICATLRHTRPDSVGARLLLRVDDYEDLTLFDGITGIDGKNAIITVETPIPSPTAFGLWEVAYQAFSSSTIDIRTRRMAHIFSVTDKD